jgi:putative ABC transport system substrate-binding protein
MPVVGFLTSTSAEAIAHLIAAFQRGLAEAVYVDGKNITIEYRFGNFNTERLPELAADLVRHKVNVLFAPTPEAGAAAKNATSAIPIVALDLESEPLAKGYVKSLARPGGIGVGVLGEDGRCRGLAKRTEGRVGNPALMPAERIRRRSQDRPTIGALAGR